MRGRGKGKVRVRVRVEARVRDGGQDRQTVEGCARDCL